MPKIRKATEAEKAEAFLKVHGIKFKAVYLEHGKHFPDDKEERDIYRLSLRRGTRGFSVRFGQSIAHSTGENVQIPRAYDLLACLTKYDPGTFTEFCREFGYSEDSRKAEKVYKACRREWDKVRRFFSTAEELEELQDIN